MAQSMKRVTELGAELSNEERNLLSVAYKVSLFRFFTFLFVFFSSFYKVVIFQCDIKCSIKLGFSL